MLIFLLLCFFTAITLQKDPQCPDGWVHLELTDSCYFLQNFTLQNTTDSLIRNFWELYSYGHAENLCEAMGAHLVSIHSKEEDDFVHELVKTNVANLTNRVHEMSTPCHHQQAYIGYAPIDIFEGDKPEPKYGNWTDGSPMDYFGALRHPDEMADNGRFRAWVISNDASCNDYSWSWPPSIFARYVCKKPRMATSSEFFDFRIGSLSKT